MKKLAIALPLILISSASLAATPLVSSITTAQDEALVKALDAKIKDKKIETAFAEAKGTVRDFLKIESCIAGYNASPLNKFAAPGKTFPDFNYLSPMSGLKYHNKSTCLTVTRVHGITMPAKNALSFEVVFSADDSEEVVKRTYTLQAQDDGSWLFK